MRTERAGTRPSIGDRWLASALALTAAGVIAFWTNWFLKGSHLHARPECYRLFENTFPLPDGVMALLMFVTAVGLWRQTRSRFFFGYLAAGMCLYLAGLDTCYHLQHGGFSDWQDPETLVRAAISTYCYLFGVLLAVALWRSEGKARCPQEKKTGAALTWILVVYGASCAYYWVTIGKNHLGNAPTGCAAGFHAAYLLSDATTVLLATGAASSGLLGIPAFSSLALMAWGGIFFALLGNLTFIWMTSGVGAAPWSPYAEFAAVFGAAGLYSLVHLFPAGEKNQAS